MREIKFRAWDVESPGMLSWDEIQDQWISEGYHPAIFNNDGYHIMQFTGLYDCNGVEIWEGDIIKKDSAELAIVAWDNDMASFVNEIIKPIDSNDNSYGVVIGNIHQHSHLLDGGGDS